MSGFEVAGIVLAGPAIVGMLVRTSLDGYKIFNSARNSGTELRLHQRDLDMQRLRLENWAKLIQSRGGDLSTLVDDKHYELILQTLVVIAGVFVDVDALHQKYGIQRSLGHQT